MPNPIEPAFPNLHIHHFENSEQDQVVVPRWMGGLTKREYFAGIALQGILAANVSQGILSAYYAVMAADALIEELNQSEKHSEERNGITSNKT